MRTNADVLKRCPACGEEKASGAFYRDRQTKSGLRTYCKACDTARVLARRARLSVEDLDAWTAERRRTTRAYLLRTYGITQETYDRMLQEQNGVCAICARPERKRNKDGVVKVLGVDHDHACCPGRTSCGRCVRGLLCDDCNSALGRFNDNVDRLVAAAAYLMRGESNQD